MEGSKWLLVLAILFVVYQTTESARPRPPIRRLDTDGDGKRFTHGDDDDDSSNLPWCPRAGRKKRAGGPVGCERRGCKDPPRGRYPSGSKPGPQAPCRERGSGGDADVEPCEPGQTRSDSGRCGWSLNDDGGDDGGDGGDDGGDGGDGGGDGGDAGEPETEDLRYEDLTDADKRKPSECILDWNCPKSKGSKKYPGRIGRRR